MKQYVAQVIMGRVRNIIVVEDDYKKNPSDIILGEVNDVAEGWEVIDGQIIRPPDDDL